MSGDRLTYQCPVCGYSIESMGRDESSRGSIKAFKADHEIHDAQGKPCPVIFTEGAR